MLPLPFVGKIFFLKKCFTSLSLKHFIKTLQQEWVAHQKSVLYWIGRRKKAKRKSVEFEKLFPVSGSGGGDFSREDVWALFIRRKMCLSGTHC